MPGIESTLTEALGMERNQLRRNANRTRWIGIGLIVLGILAILLPSTFTIGFELLLGILLLIGGILQMANAFSYFGRRYWGLPLLGGILSALLGALFLINPFAGAAVLTILLAFLFLINGIIRITHSINLRGYFPGTGWGLLNGILGIVIAALVWLAWPSSALWFIGILIGIDFMIMGIYLTAFAKACKEASVVEE